MMQELHHQMIHVITGLECGRQVVGNGAHSQTIGMQGPEYLDLKILEPQVVGQQAACDTLPQALQHDLVMTALLKQMRVHKLINGKIQKLTINPLHEVWGMGSTQAWPWSS